MPARSPHKSTAAPPRPSQRERRRSLRVHRPARGQVWLFDLDNTLHEASFAIFPEINRMMTEYVERTLRVERDAANLLRTEYSRRYGATMVGLMRHHAVDPHDFLKQVHHFPDLLPLLRAERSLRQVLRRLPGRKIVLTNGPQAYAEGVLAGLGITRYFEQVIAIEHMRDGAHWRAKPHRSMLRRVLRRARIRPAEAILVEDTRGHLKSYKRLGIRTVWMVGHLPSGPGAIKAQGRPHYVDHRIHSLKSLHTGSGPRRNPWQPLVPVHA
jgi:pyrimidine 5'-nucleotidase